MITAARSPLLALSGVALALTLTACGGTDDDDTDAAAAPTSAVSTQSAGETPSATGPSSSAAVTDDDAAAASTRIPEPINGLTEFPIPAGASVVDLGGVVNGNYQFGLSGVEVDDLTDFYEEVLPGGGYTLAEDVAKGNQQYDLAFSGPVYGVVGDLFGQPYVTVYSRPTEGINP